VRQLGGQMQIRSGNWGTAVEVLFSLEEPALRVDVSVVG
jgi:hypothetical protein